MEENYEDIKKEIKDISEETFKIEYIRRVLQEKPNLRKTFIAVIATEPSRLVEIQEKSIIARRNLYYHLHTLRGLKIIDQIAIMDLWNRNNLNEQELSIMAKFNEWTENMKPGQKNYFAAKTHYWMVSEVGKKIAWWVLKLEKELKK